MELNFIVSLLVVGLVATATGDIWQLLAGYLHRQKLNDWTPVGRWIAGFRRGEIWHEAFEDMPAVAHENAIGWITHYVVGLGYALLYLGLLVLSGGHSSWDYALLFGLVTTAAPFLWMKPAMGLGFFGSQTPEPWFTRYVTVSTHLAFGAGLHLGCLLLLCLVGGPGD